MKILGITVGNDCDSYEWSINDNCEEISGPHKNKYDEIYWEVVTDDQIFHEYFVYSVEYKKEKGE